MGVKLLIIVSVAVLGIHLFAPTPAPRDRPALSREEQARRAVAEERARIVLAIAEGQRTQTVAEAHGCDEATVWRTCRRYELLGITGLLADGRRSA